VLEAGARPPERRRADVLRLRPDARDRGVEEQAQLLTHLLKPARLGLRREAWALNDDRRAAVDHWKAEPAGGLDEDAAQVGAKWLGDADDPELGFGHEQS
jgi:hypothetical protein